MNIAKFSKTSADDCFWDLAAPYSSFEMLRNEFSWLIVSVSQLKCSLNQKKWTLPVSLPVSVLHIRISLGTKFQLKLSILFFGPNLPENGISSVKQIKWNPPLNSVYSN